MRLIFIPGIFFFFFILLTGCPQSGEENPPDDNTNPPPQSDLPPVPVPSYVGDSLPEKSDEIIIKIGDELDNFNPYVEQIYNRNAMGGFSWEDKWTHIDLLINDEIQYIGWEGCVYLNEIPRIKHSRYWKKVFSVVIDESASYSETHSITYGVSETRGQEFSVTVGGEVSTWFVTVSTEISNSVSYEISYSTETTIDKEFSCDGTEGKITIFTVWQLVDRFSISNSKGEEISDDDESKTLFSQTIKIHPIDSVEEVSDKQFYLSTVLFDK